MKVYLIHTDLIPEPSGAVSLAAVLYHSDELPPAKKIVVVMSGGNVDPALLKALQDELATTAV